MEAVPTVNSWNEWDPLTEVVVGCADGAMFEPVEPCARPRVRQRRGETEAKPWPAGPKDPGTIERANEELAGLVTLLERQGVTVRRPKPIDFARAIETPMFSVENQYCATCPRDVMITIGNEILEAPMSRRARFFEYLCYRDLVHEYWSKDPGMTWTSAPKPTMGQAMYREGFWDWTTERRREAVLAYEYGLNQEEVIFDAADISRLGRDLVIHQSMTTNRAGIRWLKRHLEPRGLRVHEFHFPSEFFPTHIDTTFVPLRPGLILTNPVRPLKAGEEKFFRDNDWQLVTAPQPVLANDEMPAHCQSSHWLSMNVLSLSPKTILCEAQETPIHELFDKLGFNVLTVPFRNVYEFGGSLHCATWDVRRSGKCEDYFPQLSREQGRR